MRLAMATSTSSNSTCNNTPVKGVTPLKPSADAQCQKDTLGKFLTVNCGSEEGKFYAKKLMSGTSKCILSGSKWYSPSEFESLGGKAKAKNWKKSIQFNNSPLSVWLDSDASSSKNLGTSPYNERVLSNHVLAFIKAFRLRGDRFSLRQAVMEKFSDSDLLEAMQVLWDHCHDSLEKLGVEFVRRRASDKRSLLDVVLADILDALDKLDVDDTIPLIFCEASDLLKLNSDAVLSSLKSLSEELQGKVSRSDGVAD